jgi:hypothetical protein
MDDFVVAKNGRFEDAGHPVQGLNGLFDAGAETTRRCENYLVDTHVASLVMASFRECLG